MAQDDVKVALGLLDARHVAGDPALTDPLHPTPPPTSGGVPRSAQLPGLREITAARWQAHGELAFLLEGDLKEAAGGLRDVGCCAPSPPPGSPTRCGPPSAPPTCACWTPATPCTSRSAGGSTGCSPRSATVAGLLGLRAPGTGTADPGDRRRRRRRAAASGRQRRPDRQPRPATTPSGPPTGCAPARRRGADGRPLRRPVARDVVEQDGELVLARTAIGARPDPSLSLRVAAAAATRRAADRPRDLRVAGRLLPAAADAVADRRPAPR